MNTFVSAEYVIANALIALKRKGSDFVTFDRLREIGVMVQTSFNQQGVDAIVLTAGDSISMAIYNFSDYFLYEEVDGVPAIRIQKDTTIDNLESRFVGYLPVEVLSALIGEISKIVA